MVREEFEFKVVEAAEVVNEVGAECDAEAVEGEFVAAGILKVRLSFSLMQLSLQT